MFIDTHAHLNFHAFKEDADTVAKRTLENDIWVINVGSQYTTSKRAVEMTERYKEGIFAAVGLHPIHLEERKVDIAEVGGEFAFKTRAEEFDYEKYQELAQNKKVVAIGEIGLDYYYKPKTKKKLEIFKQKQKETFLQQFNLAKELNVPVIFHCRVAHDDLISILNTKYQLPQHQSKARCGAQQDTGFRGVIHCFTGNSKQAQKFLDLGLYLGFNGLKPSLALAPTPRELLLVLLFKKKRLF